MLIGLPKVAQSSGYLISLPTARAVAAWHQRERRRRGVAVAALEGHSLQQDGRLGKI